MPIKDYSVLLGTKAGYHRDLPNNFGRYFHGHIDVQTPGQLFKTAIDVDTEAPGKKVEWRVLHLRTVEWASIFGLADGLHPIPSNDASGAVDYIRDPRLKTIALIPDLVAGPIPFWRRWLDRLGSVFNPERELAARPAFRIQARRVHMIDLTPPWKMGTDIEALTDLESMIETAVRVVIFGSYYPPKDGKPAGLHDIHQNQGDPIGGGHDTDNAIWQDGLTIAIHADGTASAFMNKFNSQSSNTDDQGRPI